ncbi:MAG: glutamine--fructose-6-phosphate transaminase (isomerizing) [Clostridiales bacterium]|jgi:glucosamine--fructose-6-phosphate aminotransferase (isomerizing)|nr:glutamine--fructose-6-phosphate transaminase (isomerizing) [Clostridiales bacterium]
MCGIVGYTGDKHAAPILLAGLGKLEYRGYDSAGIAVIENKSITVKKTKGRLSALRDMIESEEALKSNCGIGHTRWATHGEPSDSNAHPHLSHSGRVAVVHNGIVENYMALRDFLLGHGYTFQSETDTEIVSQLLDYCYHGDPLGAAREAMHMLEGSFALGILFSDFPRMIIAARKDSPLVVGLGDHENFIASDIPALLKHTRRVLRLQERELAVVTPEEVVVYDRQGDVTEKTSETVTWDVSSAEKGGYRHFMIKEIMEQPRALRDTINPRIRAGRVTLELKNIGDDFFQSLTHIQIVACGSAWHVGCIAKLMLQDMLRVPVHCELASEFRYSNPMIHDQTLCVVISQSGETIDTLFALREARSRGAKVLSIVNVVGSTIVNESDDVLYTWAGPEIAVATTKAYNTQLGVFYLIALYMADLRGRIDTAGYSAAIDGLRALPDKAQGLLQDHTHIQQMANRYFNQGDIFFMGRNLDYALALEGSLKLKEISYIHSEAYAAGELKHGTISLIEPGTLVVALCTNMKLLEKMIGNTREVKARGADVIAIAQEGAPGIEEVADHMIWLPAGEPFTLPSLSVLPLQLFAYYIALEKGCDIDKPSNLA